MNKYKLTNKEYKKLKENYGGYSFYDALTREERSELYYDIKDRIKDGQIYLEGSNHRATIKWLDDRTIMLISYYTEICTYNYDTEEFNKLWYDYSATTMKHINLFRNYCGLSPMDKREWIEL